jgi:hypothetical protein
MNYERDEANLMGQVAGIIAVMSAVVEALPPTTRNRLLQQLHTRFESLLAAMRATGATEGESGREGAEWVRDLFLQQIAKAGKKPKGRKAPLPAENAVDVQL